MMHQWLSITCTLGLLLLSAAEAGDFDLTVVNGSGSGRYSAGARVFIAADPYETGEPTQATWETAGNADEGVSTFSAWRGADFRLDDSRSPETWVTMPERDMTVAASYTHAERWAPPVVWQMVPPAPIGVIFMFHGGQGSSASMASKAESGVFVQQAVAQGYGVVFVESFERKDAEFNWDKNPDPIQNLDLQRVAAVRQRLIENGEMTDQTPVFLWGVSGGGQFASLFTEDTQQILDFPVAAQVLIVAAGEAQPMRRTQTPTLFLIGDNDRGVRQAALNAFADLQLRGVPTQLHINEPIPIHADRFWRIQGLNRADSNVIYAALRAGGILDANDFLVERPKTLDWVSEIPLEYEPFLRAIEDQLYIAYGGHRLMSNLNYLIFDFFVDPSAQP